MEHVHASHFCLMSFRITPLLTGGSLSPSIIPHGQRRDGVCHYTRMLDIIHLACFLSQLWYVYHHVFLFELVFVSIS